MMRGSLTLLALLSVVLFPWPLSVLLAGVTALSEPLVPLAAGLFADTLYYVPQTGMMPLFTIGGALLSLLAYSVRARLNTGSIGG